MGGEAVSLALSIPQNALRASQDEGEGGFYTLTLTLSQGERGFYPLKGERGLRHAVMAGLDPAIPEKSISFCVPLFQKARDLQES